MELAEVVAHPLPDDTLPTELQIYQHYLYLNELKIESGEWKKSTPLPLAEKVKFVISDVAAQWDQTDIPHELSERSRKDCVGRVITRIKKLKGRDEKILEGFENLCDLAQCKCTDHCNCVLEDQVPSAWKEFLADQRGERKLSIRKFSLRGPTARGDSDRKRRSEFESKLEEKRELLAKKQKFEQRCRTE